MRADNNEDFKVISFKLAVKESVDLADLSTSLRNLADQLEDLLDEGFYIENYDDYGVLLRRAPKGLPNE